MKFSTLISYRSIITDASSKTIVSSDELIGIGNGECCNLVCMAFFWCDDHSSGYGISSARIDERGWDDVFWFCFGVFVVVVMSKDWHDGGGTCVTIV